MLSLVNSAFSWQLLVIFAFYAHYDYTLLFRGGVLAVDLSYMTYSIVLLIFIFWKKLYKDTWYGRCPLYIEMEIFLRLKRHGPINFLGAFPQLPFFLRSL